MYPHSTAAFAYFDQALRRKLVPCILKSSIIFPCQKRFLPLSILLGMQHCSERGCSEQHSWPGMAAGAQRAPGWMQWNDISGQPLLSAQVASRQGDLARLVIGFLHRCNYLTNEGWVCMNILSFTMTMNCSIAGLGLGHCCQLDATFHLKLFYNF